MDPLDLIFRIADRSNLRAAWARVCANRGGPGIDGVTIRDFMAREQDELDSIECDLLAGSYHPDRIQTVTVMKDSGKTRIIGLLTLRDRVCAFAVTRVLRSILDPLFQPSSFAYRPGRSALDAANYLERLIRRGMTWVLESDIEKYFDTISHGILLDKLRVCIGDDTTCSLVKRFIEAPVTGAVRMDKVTVGITQGNPLSPLLANLYLNDLDKAILDAGYRYIRYADDLVIAGDSEETMQTALAMLVEGIIRLELRLSDPKTRIAPVKEGFAFLGFQFNEKGKGPAVKSIESIREKLMESAAETAMQSPEKQLEHIRDVLRGWHQYFQAPANLFEEMPLPVLAAGLCESIEMQNPDMFRRLAAMIRMRTESGSAIHGCLARFLASRKRNETAAVEYLAALLCEDADDKCVKESLEYLGLDQDAWTRIRPRVGEIWTRRDESETWTELSELFAEHGEFELAMIMGERNSDSENQAGQPGIRITGTSGADTPEEKGSDPDGESDDDAPEPDKPGAGDAGKKPETIQLSDNSLGLFSRYFRGRDGVIAWEDIDELGNKTYRKLDEPLTRERLQQHFTGTKTYGIYMVQPDETVHMCLLDVDVKKRFILLRAEQDQGFEDLVDKTHEWCCKLYEEAKKLGVIGLMEDSGYKGRHLWFCFEEPVRMKQAREFLNMLVARVEPPPEEICIELFPCRDRLKPDGLGDLIKLPLGINRKSGEFSLFINRDGRYPDPEQAIHALKPVSRKKWQTLVARPAPGMTPVRNEPETAAIALNDLQDIPARGPVRRVLKQCAIMRYLVNKAQKIGHLTHIERVTLLYVFGHLGDEGKAFLHRTIAFCMNYDPNYTQTQIERMKPSPISCPRIKETFPQVTPSLRCNCHFGPLDSGVYPTPVLHANDAMPGGQAGRDAGVSTRFAVRAKPDRSGDAGMTLNESEGIDTEVDELVRKYMNIRRNFRGIEQSLKRIEEFLLKKMEELDMDSLETTFGTLRYIRRDGEVARFIIEI